MNLSSPILIWNIKVENLFKELHFLIINIMMEQVTHADLPGMHIIWRDWKKTPES